MTEDNKLNIKLSKDVINYKDIVNVVQTANMDENYAKLIDKDGNQFAYYGAENTKEKMQQAGLDVYEVLKENDAYHALKKTGGLIITGATGTNVNDVAVVLIRRRFL